jgi:hypothetical protein
MKKIFLILLLSIVLSGKESYERETFQSAIFLSEIASSINKQLPMMVDKETRLDVVMGMKQNITYKYTLVNTNQNDFTSEEIENLLKQTIKNSVCTNPKVRIFPENGVSMNYSYYSKDGKFMAEFTIFPKDCGF